MEASKRVSVDFTYRAPDASIKGTTVGLQCAPAKGLLLKSRGVTFFRHRNSSFQKMQQVFCFQGIVFEFCK